VAANKDYQLIQGN